MLSLCPDQQSTNGYSSHRLYIAYAWHVVGRRSERGNHSLHRACHPNHGARQFRQRAGNPVLSTYGGASPETPTRRHNAWAAHVISTGFFVALSAFTVAIGSKADMAYCTAYVCF